MEENKENNKKKSNKYLWIIIISVVVIIVGIVLLNSNICFDEIFNSNTPKRIKDDEIPKMNKDFIYIGEASNNIVEDDYVFTSLDDFNEKLVGLNFDNDFNASVDLNFEEFNYLPVMIYDVHCGGETIPTDYKINGNNITITLTRLNYCSSDVCPYRTYYYLLKIDKSLTEVSVNKDNNRVDVEYNCIPNGYATEDKPLIYIYPEEKTEVSIKLVNDRLLSVTYPKYDKQWKVTAYPNGDLYDSDGKYYYGLYWEGNSHNINVTNEGFVIEGKDTIKFLEEKLKILGLNDREINEFIIYWLPKMENNKYNYIRFETMEEINNYMPLEITPKPDTLIRIVMDFKPLNDIISVKEQKLTQINRKGYTVVEWGGSLIN